METEMIMTAHQTIGQNLHSPKNMGLDKQLKKPLKVFGTQEVARHTTPQLIT
jgi:hypothetical protein